MIFVKNVLKYQRLLFRTTRHYTVSHSKSPERLSLCEDKDGIRTITLNNPSKSRGSSQSTQGMLCPLICSKACKRTSQRRALILVSLSSRPLEVFSVQATTCKSWNRSSFHRKLTLQLKDDVAEQTFDLLSSIVLSLQDHPVPVIAQVQGLATAAGCQLVASCDIAVAAASARFATPGVANSLFCTTPAVALSRCVPKKTALLMLLTAQPISAQEALQCGLVSKVVSDDLLESSTHEIALRIKQASRPVVRMGKRAFYAQMQLPIHQAYRLASKSMVENLGLEDAREGIEAFMAKRKAHWTHRGNE